MPTNRKVAFSNNEVYHVFNRGVERRPSFTNQREFARAVDTMAFYRFANLSFKFSKFSTLPREEKAEFIQNINSRHSNLIEIICYCFMPNHFHFLLKQKQENGISKFTANFTNSYTKYFNSKHDRVGPLFQGLFKAVRVESEEQLMHLSRYIHLNPVSSFLIKPAVLDAYRWSSYPEYRGLSSQAITDKETVLYLFSSKEQYQQFILDQISYAQELEKIKHLVLD